MILKMALVRDYIHILDLANAHLKALINLNRE